MNIKKASLAAIVSLCIVPVSGFAQSEGPQLTDEEAEKAASQYQQYCALCHGDDRQGHVNDHAPSLKSKSLMATGFPWAVMYATAYGRAGTPMAPFFEEVGGPLSREDMWHMGVWLRQQVDVEDVELSREPIKGDITLGEQVYARECSECHGDQGEGGKGTALANHAMLAFTSDEFLKYAILNGRDGTEMVGFADKLSEDEVDGVTAFIRSRSMGWTLEKAVYREPPPADKYVMNPDGDAPDFELKDDRYVMSADLDRAFREGRRMVLLDTRNMALWQAANIEGSVPLPYYYEDIDELAEDLPTDGTMIVTYCECPRAAAESVNRKLTAKGFENTAVLWEGMQGWIALGYPIVMGQTEEVAVAPVHEPE